MCSFPGELLCILVQPAYLIHFLCERIRIFRLFRGMEPVTDLMWTQFYLIFKKRLTDFSEIRSAIPCFLISAVKRGRLHWLTS